MVRPPERARAAEVRLRHGTADSRDDTVREAAAARLSIARIQQVTGLAATTIQRILNNPPSRGRRYWPMSPPRRRDGTGGQPG